MSLENAVLENSKLLTELIALTKQEIELRQQSLATVGAAITKATGAKTTPAAEKEKAPVTEKADAATDDHDATMKFVKKGIASYLGGTERPEERKARQAKIKKLLNHEQVRGDNAPEVVTDLKDVKPSALKSVLKNVNKFIEAGDLTEPVDEDGDMDLG